MQATCGGDERKDKRRKEEKKEKDGEKCQRLKTGKTFPWQKKRNPSMKKAVISLQKNDRPSLKHKCFYLFMCLFIFEGGTII